MAKDQCPYCKKMYGRVNLHIERVHSAELSKGGQGVGQENSSSAPALPESQAKPVKFISSRSPELTVIIRPTRKGFINTSGGSMETVFEGKKVQFRNGVLVTDDPEVIDYLTNKYFDRRYPVTNLTKTTEAINK